MHFTHLWLRWGYRPTSRLLHRLNLHHTNRIGPLEPTGEMVEKCEWCGISRTIPVWEVQGRVPTSADLRALTESEDE